MKLIDELNKVMLRHESNSITFYKMDIPIVTIRFYDNGDIFVITNNMKEMNVHKLHWDGNMYNLANEIDNILIKDEVSVEGVTHVEFNDGMFFNGRIEKDKIVIRQPEFYIDEEGEEVSRDSESVIYIGNVLSESTIADIASVYISQYFS